MHTQRLTALAKLLCNILPEKFNLENWRVSDQDDTQTEVSDAKLRDPTCGTCGCAVGWACALPAFKKQGLGWKYFGPTYALPGEEGRLTLGWSAVHAFFELSGQQAEYLFSYGSYDDGDKTKPAEVAARIHQLLKDAAQASISTDSRAGTPV